MQAYKAVLIIRYDAQENIFLDQCGFEMVDVYTALTPNDVYLFRRTGQHYFRHRGDRHILCEIIIEE